MRTSVLALALSTLALPALAQQSGFTVSGYASIGHLWSGGEQTRYLDADFDLGYALGNGLGVELGYRGVAFDSDEFDTPFVSLSYRTGAHKVSIGLPRSAMNLADSPQRHGANALMIGELSFMIGDTVTLVGMQNHDRLYGLRYDGDFGKAHVAASLHQARLGSSSLNIFALGSTYALSDQVSLRGGMEFARSTGGSAIRRELFLLGADYSSGPLKAGATLTRTVMSSGSTMGITGLGLYADYMVAPKITLAADYSHFKADSSSDSTSIWGVSASYELVPHVALTAGYGAHEGGDGVTTVSLGAKF